MKKLFRRTVGRPPGAEPAPGLSEDAESLLGEYEKSGRGWFWTTDAECNVRYITSSVAESLGVEPGVLVGQPLETLFDLEAVADQPSERTLPLLLKARKSFTGLAVRAASDEDEIWWSISGRPKFDKQGEFTGFYGNGENITATRQEMRKASRMALFDSLTGLANRNRMGQLLDQAVKNFTSSGRNSALMMLDLDRFKQVNDTMGHSGGDELLKQVAERISGIVGAHGEVGRLGGDEFQIVFPDLEDRGQLGEIARKIIAVLVEPFSLETGRCTIGASIGVAILPHDGETADLLVRHADLALYAAKAGGRRQFRFYTSELHIEARRRQQLEADLRTALEADQIRLFYQPQVETTKGRVVALEAQLRWFHPEYGEIQPAVLQSIADSTNLQVQLGNWAVRQACHDVVQLPGNVRVAVNISALQLEDQSFADVVTQALTSSELAPERLELELDGAALQNAALFKDGGIAALRMLGVRLAFDDFGAGPISPVEMKSLPLDAVKLAVTLVEAIAGEDTRDKAVIRALCDIARAIKLEVRANGVEARDQLAAVKDMGIAIVQGGTYSGSLPFDEVVDAMASGAWMLEPGGPSRYRSDRRTVFRRVGLIHENFRYEAMMRNLSSTGCLIEGLLDVPVGENFVVDLGDGQLAVGYVRRSTGAMIGVEFEMPLVDDGAGGLVTRNRVSRAAMAAAGLDRIMYGKPGELSDMVSPRFAQVTGSTGRMAGA